MNMQWYSVPYPITVSGTVFSPAFRKKYPSFNLLVYQFDLTSKIEKNCLPHSTTRPPPNLQLPRGEYKWKSEAHQVILLWTIYWMKKKWINKIKNKKWFKNQNFIIFFLFFRKMFFSSVIHNLIEQFRDPLPKKMAKKYRFLLYWSLSWYFRFALDKINLFDII